MLTTNQLLKQGRYRIVSQLGQNGIGIGYEAFDTLAGADILLKEIRDTAGKVATLAQIEARKAVYAEKAAQIMQIKHESILTVTDFFSDIDHHYLVAELLEGNALSELLEKKRSPFPLSDAMSWADSLLDALHYLHTREKQVIHGEVKPKNIKLLPNGKVKLQIFHLIKPSSERTHNSGSGQTFDAAALPYLPLEQIWEGLDAASKKVILTNFDEKSEKILEQEIDSRSDLYALAATLYHLLTAQTPADALTRSIEILEGNPDPLVSPSKINSIVPPQVSEVLMKALEIKREDRFSSASIMRQVLRTAFVRTKEATSASRDVKTEDDAVLEIPVMERKTPAPKNAEMVAEQTRQLELIKQQLREAEAQRIEAERRAVEAEKRLHEAAIHQSAGEAVSQTVPAAPVASAEMATPFADSEEKPAAPAAEYQTDEFSNLFSEPQKEGSGFKKFAAAAVVLLILGAGGFGVWTFTKTQSVQAVQSVTTSTVMPESTVQPTPAAVVETTPAPEQTTAQTGTSTETAPDTEASNPNSANPATVKQKAAPPVPQTAQVKKPTATPAKQNDAQKKVTLDDLLKDN